MRTFNTDDFWTLVTDDISRAAYESTGRRMFVDAVEGNLIRLKDLNDEPSGVAAYVGLEKLSPGDAVWVEPVARLLNGKTSKLQSWVVVGRVLPSGSVAHAIEGSSLILPNGTDLIGASDDGPTVTWQIDGATGAAIFASYNSPVVGTASQTVPDTASTTSTGSYSPAMSLAVPLGSGTWTLNALGFLDCEHSTGDRVNVAVEIDGDAGVGRSPSCPSATFRTVRDDHELAGVVGARSVTCRVLFRALDPGTVTASTTNLLVIARRTS